MRTQERQAGIQIQLKYFNKMLMEKYTSRYVQYKKEKQRNRMDKKNDRTSLKFLTTSDFIQIDGDDIDLIAIVSWGANIPGLWLGSLISNNL